MIMVWFVSSYHHQHISHHLDTGIAKCVEYSHIKSVLWSTLQQFSLGIVESLYLWLAFAGAV
jgi:hypothetical protein